MAWRYRCRTCEESTDWMDRVDAEHARARHRDQTHGGLIPDREEFNSNASRVKPTNFALLTAVLLLLSALSWAGDKI